MGNDMEYGEVTLSLGQAPWFSVIRMSPPCNGFNSLNPLFNKALTKQGVLDLTSTGECGPDLLALTAIVVPVIGAASAVVRFVPLLSLLH
jgi:hypothetical protein